MSSCATEGGGGDTLCSEAGSLEADDWGVACMLAMMCKLLAMVVIREAGWADVRTDGADAENLCRASCKSSMVRTSMS